jgi:CIC family chloride channel protein
LPVILSNTIAYLLSRALQPVPIFEIFTHQDGLYLPSMEEQREQSNLHLEDALQPASVPVLQGSDTIAAAANAFSQYAGAPESTAVLVQCTDGLWYAATRSEMEAILTGSAPDPATAPSAPADAAAAVAAEAPAPLDSSITLQQRLGSERTPVLFPDLPLASALPHFRRWPLLPISNRAVRGALEGTVSLEDVLRRYQQR